MYLGSRHCTWCSSVGVRVFVTIECVTVSRLCHRPTPHSFPSQEDHSNTNTFDHKKITRTPTHSIVTKYSTASRSNTTGTVPWFGFILTFICLSICLIFYAAYTRYHRLKKEKEKTEVTLLASQELLDESVSDLKLLSEAMQVDDEEIVYKEKIAKGAFAEVYRAMYVVFERGVREYD